MPTRLITGPATEPVTLAEAKAHLRLEHALDDAYVMSLIAAARQWVEQACWRGLITQLWEQDFDTFPEKDWLELPFGQLVSITSVKYLSTSGALLTLSATDYEPDTSRVPGRVLLYYGTSWPATYRPVNSVVVRYTVGWASAVDVPEPIKQALLLLVSQLYEHRTPEVVGTIVSPVRFAVDALLAPYRLVRYLGP